jgi:tetratricopeptide (TPR) repeat protein
LSLLESGTVLNRLLPRARETRRALVAELDRTRRAHLIVELHDLADRIRFLYATGPRSSSTVRKLEHRLAEIWQARNVIDRQLAREADAGMRARIRGDLLDLAILWADLRVELADESGRNRARRDALRSLSQAEADWGPSPVLLQEQRFHAEAIGQMDQAEAAATRAAGMSPRTAWECYALGRALLRNGDLETAATALDRAAELQPQSLWAQFYRGQCALRRGRCAEAVDAFGACVALAPEAVCYYNRHLAYAGLGDHNRARLDLERARTLDPDLHVNPREIAPRPTTKLTPVSK